MCILVEPEFKAINTVIEMVYAQQRGAGVEGGREQQLTLVLPLDGGVLAVCTHTLYIKNFYARDIGDSSTTPTPAPAGLCAVVCVCVCVRARGLLVAGGAVSSVSSVTTQSDSVQSAACSVQQLLLAIYYEL